MWTEDPTGASCLVVDVKGVLAALYGIADIAFVGGTLVPVGGHNILEPLAHGVPVIIGPQHHHFTDVVTKASRDNICRVFTTVDQGAAATLELLDIRRKPGNESGEIDPGIFISKMRALLEKMEIEV